MIAAPKKKFPTVSVSPNAAKGSFRVLYPRTNLLGPLTAQLMGTDGIMLNVPIEVHMMQTGEVNVAISNPCSGIFYLRIMDGTTSILKKIIVQ